MPSPHWEQKTARLLALVATFRGYYNIHRRLGYRGIAAVAVETILRNTLCWLGIVGAPIQH